MASGTLKLNGALKLGRLPSAPSDPSGGLIYYDSTASEFRLYNGSTFVQVADYGQLGSSTSGSSGATQIKGDNKAYANIAGLTTYTLQDFLDRINAALAGSASGHFSDATFDIYNGSDNTKIITFDASSITTGTTRTITMADANVNLSKVNTSIQRDGSVAFTANQPMGGFKLTGLGAGSGAGDSVRYEQAILVNGANAFSANQSFGGFRITNLGDPVGAQDGVTLSYLSARLAGLKPKQSVRAATTVAGTLASSFENGDTIDTVTLVTGDRILIKNQAAPEENGIYTVNASGAPTRAVDFDSLTPIDEINGAWTAVQEGSQAGEVWVQYGTVATLNTDPINFEYFNPIANLIGGDMITFSSSVFSVDLATVSGLESTNPGNNAGQLRIKLEASNPSLQIDGSNQLGVKLYSGGAIVKNSSGLAWNPDNTTLEVSSNAAQIKDNGVSNAKFRQSAGLSVVARASNTTGNVADLTAGTDAFVLRRNGTSLEFALLDNSNLSATAAIALSKLAALTVSRALQSNASTGFIEVSSVTNTELGYVSGVTSAIQTQINGKLSSVSQDTTPQLGGNLDLNAKSLLGLLRLANSGSPTRYWEEEYIDATTLTASTTAVAAAFTFDSRNIKGLEIFYTILSGTDRRIGKLDVVCNAASGADSTTIDLTDLSNETADVGVTWTAAMNSHNVELSYTTTSGTKTMRALCRRILA